MLSSQALETSKLKIVELENKLKEYEDKISKYEKEIEDAKRLSLDSKRKDSQITSIKQRLNDTLEVFNKYIKEFKAYREKSEEWEKTAEKQMRFIQHQGEVKSQKLIDTHSEQVNQLEQLIQVLSNTIISIYTCILTKNNDLKV